MALSEQTGIDKVEILFTPGGPVVQVRETTTIFRDGVALSKSHHRYSKAPGNDLTGLSDDISSLCNLVFTPGFKP